MLSRPIRDGGVPVPVFPPLPLAEWADTKDTLHRFLQIVGKLRLAHAPRRNHWWHVPFHLTGRGLTTRPMGFDPVFAVDLDLVDHRLEVAVADGRRASFPLPGLSVAAFYRQLLATLSASACRGRSSCPSPSTWPTARRSPRTSTTRPTTGSGSPATGSSSARWPRCSRSSPGRSYAKTSPVHHFWHTFDLAVTRFSDRRVEQPDTVDPVTREAYSHEVISAGFWFGDDAVPEPAFYTYAAPEPPGLTDEPLRPAAARWVDSRGCAPGAAPLRGRADVGRPPGHRPRLPGERLRRRRAPRRVGPRRAALPHGPRAPMTRPAVRRSAR
jgi:hypothetical protein